MVTSIYAGLLALLIVYLTMNVVKLRRAHKVRLGDGGVPQLLTAIRAHSNAVEYIPIALILMLLLELAKIPVLALHVAGIALLTGRLLHAKGLLANDLKFRVPGMQITIYTIIALAAVNIFYALYQQFFA